MTFNCTIELDYGRLIRSVNCDSTAIIPALRGASGNAIEDYNQGQVAQISKTVLVYRVETEQGNLCCFFALQTATSPVLVIFQQIRPAFIQFQQEINQSISNFILDGTFLYDTIY